MKTTHLSYLVLSFLALASCKPTSRESGVAHAGLAYCARQTQKTLAEIGDTTLFPMNIGRSESHWNMTTVSNWVSGFWPGILWYVYEYTQDEAIKNHAVHYTQLLKPLSEDMAYDHDLGFQLFCSYGNAFRLTNCDEYKQVILSASDRLAKLYNPKVGTILSWPGEWAKEKYAPHNTIMDNMMNLEMLFWASRNGGEEKLFDIARSHAEVTMKNQFREDGSCYHVALYDTLSGNFIKGLTHQGYADESAWARGQAWAIYGYTVVYRETRDTTFLRFAEKITDYYLDHLPDDGIPYWDFKAPDIPDAPRDASAAAIVSSALIELSQLEDKEKLSEKYRLAAIGMIESLSTAQYQSRDSNPSFLLHSTGHFPAGKEIDASIVYADYYYIEALTRLKNMEE